MADLDSLPVTFYSESTPYTASADNTVVRALNDRILAVNAHIERLAAELQAARGSKSSLDARLDISLDEAGLVRDEAVVGLSATQVDEQTSVPPADDDRVWMTRVMREKLAGISTRARRTLVALGQGEPVDGVVRIVLGNTMFGTMRDGGDGTRVLSLDTVFSSDRVHEHRHGVIISNYSDGVGWLPEGDTAPISGSVRLFINGLLQSPRTYEEVTDTATGKVVAVRVTAEPERVDNREDLLWVDYETRPSSTNSTQSISQSPAYQRFEKTLTESADLASISLPTGSPQAKSWNYWMIDVSSLRLRAPYSNCLLLVTPGVRRDTDGHALQAYGYDWDIVSWNGGTFLRWRYDRNTGATDGVPTVGLGDRWDFMTENGAGTPEVPCGNFAGFDLVAGAHIEFLYVV